MWIQSSVSLTRSVLQASLLFLFLGPSLPFPSLLTKPGSATASPSCHIYLGHIYRGPQGLCPLQSLQEQPLGSRAHRKAL